MSDKDALEIDSGSRSGDTVSSKPSTTSTKGLLLKRKDFLDADESANSYSNRTYYFKRNEDLDGIIETCSKKLTVRVMIE
jgi:hypothetical protein